MSGLRGYSNGGDILNSGRSREVLVTGGAGFIGGRVVQKLELVDDRVDILDIREPRYSTTARYIPGSVDSMMFHLSEPGRIPYDVIFHCAAILGAATTFDRAAQTELVNAVGTIAALDYAVGKDTIVIRPGVLGTWLNPYMISTKAAEQYVQAYRKYRKVRACCVRFTVVYGPGQELGVSQGKAVPTFISRTLRDEPLVIYGDGSYKVRLLYVDDAADALIKVAQHYNEVPEAFDITSRHPENYISVKDLAEKIIQLTGSNSSIEYVPMRIGQPLDWIDARANPDQSVEVGDLIMVQDEVPLDIGLLNTIEWLREGR